MKGVKSPMVDIEMLVGVETEGKGGTGVEGCSDGADEVESANVEGVTSDVDDNTLSVTDGMEVDSYDGGKDREGRVEVGVTEPSDSSVGVNDVGRGEEGKDGGSGDKATVESEEMERSAGEGDKDGGSGGKAMDEEMERSVGEGDKDGGSGGKATVESEERGRSVAE